MRNYKIYRSVTQRRQSGLKSGGGSWIRVTKISIFQGKFSRNFDFFQAILQKILIFPGKFLKNFDFFTQIFKKFQFFRQFKENFNFPGKNCSFTAIFWQIFTFPSKSHNFRTYFRYMVRYNNISRPVHNPPRPILRFQTTPSLKSGGRGPQLPRIDALVWLSQNSINVDPLTLNPHNYTPYDLARKLGCT